MTERPIECGPCKKAVKVIYKEIVGNSVVLFEMCEDCPVLQEKLHGTVAQKIEGAPVETGASLCCGSCGTTLASVKMGHLLGCSECYTIFGDLLVSELTAQNKISPRLKKALETKKTQPLHAGKSPTKSSDMNLSSRVTELSEALSEALKKENYEQAAWLRDQIKALREKGHGTE